MTSPERMIAIIAALLAQAATAAVVPPPTPTTPPPVETPVASPDTAEGLDPADLALVLQSVDLRMTTQVTVNGKGPYRFIVDTGATRSVISRRLAAELGLTASGKRRLVSTGGVREVEVVRIDELGLGKLIAGPVVAPLLDEANIGAAGMLGIDVLANRQVEMDLIADRMTIRKGASRPASTSGEEIVVVARRRYGELVLVDADIDGEPIYVVLDTGASGSLGNMALKNRLERRLRRQPVKTVMLLDVVGNVLEAQASQLPTIRLGGVTVVSAPAAFADVETFRQFGLIGRPAMLLGMDVLRSFRRVIVDFGTKKVRFQLR
ncbi:aspartyl protease family protein [Sphingomonas naphthae]|uniref:Aspartyl protease family protein n=1 Tax=Sphingomonas naphthae TaxID=1813468 RepID=A0ABY7TJ86_9SPHN|nr:aspartyl protease family protein [Sphingomonas naphthae]WCT73291.1 aspartyl protease family protein [Sphingomonas naphthae]